MHVPRCVSVQKYLNKIIAASFFSYIYFLWIFFAVSRVDSRSLRFIFNVYVCLIVYDFCLGFFLT